MPSKKKAAPVAATKPQPLTRQQRKAQTRALLIEIGRRHILQYGLGGAAAERISNEAGFTRGAFYLNFQDIEDLFLAVLHEEQQQRFRFFRTILEEHHEAGDLLDAMRRAMVKRVTDPEWVTLQAELEAGALRSEKLRRMYADFYRMMLAEGRQLLKQLLVVPKVRLTIQPNEFLMAMLTFSHGMALNQRLLGSDLSPRSTKKVIEAVFDCLLVED